MKRIVIGFAWLALAACAHGLSGELPSPPEAATAARLTVIRSDNLPGWGIAVRAAIDESAAVHLRAGEHANIRLAPGLHRIAVTGSAVTFAAEPGQSYYFLVSADDSRSGFEIERLDESRGRQWAGRTRPLP